MVQHEEHDREMAEVEYDLEMLFLDLDSDSDEDIEVEDDIVEIMVGTTAAETRRGIDIQRIPWHSLKIVRQKHRETKLKWYRNRRDVPQSEIATNQVDKICKNVRKGGNFYEFHSSTRSVYPTFEEHQLRNLVWATSKHDVYLSSEHSIIHWSALSHRQTQVLNADSHIVASEIHSLAEMNGFRDVEITSMAAKDDLLVVGGYEGELICKYLGIKDVSYCSRITENIGGNNASTNSIEIYQTPGGATRLLTSCNDCGVRVFDLSEGFARIKDFPFPWAVNHASVNPDNNLFLVVGDNVDGFLSDCQTGKNVATLKGHLDYSFASAWHPNGILFATGNQDTTCRLWDVRNTSASLEVLKGNMGAIRSIKFSLDGQFMAMAEQADFVHIYDTKHMYNKSQEIDFFGEITGISFSPDSESLFIGVEGVMFGGLLEYTRRHEYLYLDSLM